MHVCLGPLTRLLVCAVFCCVSSCIQAQIHDPQYSDWPEDLRIDGRVIVDNGLSDFSGIAPLLKRHLKSKKVLTLSVNAGDDGPKWTDMFREMLGEDLRRVSIELSETGDMKSQVAVATAQIDQADFVHVVAVDKPSLEVLSSLQEPLRRVLERSGTVVLGMGASRHAGRWVADSSKLRLAVQGLGLIPDVVVGWPGEGAEDEIEEATTAVVRELPGAVGVMVQSGTALMLSGRKLTCFGSGKVTVVVPESEVTPEYRQQISEFRSRRQSPSQYLIDLTQWRRLAIERQLPKFPPTTPPVPHVESGTLLIVGGGGSPKGLMDRFVELAGGIEKARLVYVPCTEDDIVSSRQSMVAVWKRMGVKHATFIHTKDRKKANTDDEFLEPLKNATGIFCGGGRQWNFSDSYYGTKTQQLMKDVLARGGVIAGSSAGASIQARYLARATPIGNFDIMAPGYERGGLGFLGGVAIDQHFSERGRQKDMVQLMNTHSQLLGIGIDEATAIEVQKSRATVSGKGRVFFYDAMKGSTTNRPHFDALSAGSVYDLASRTVVIDSPQDAKQATKKGAKQ